MPHEGSLWDEPGQAFELHIDLRLSSGSSGHRTKTLMGFYFGSID
jgi:hypothetical protein